MGSSWGDFVCDAFGSQESLVGETKESVSMNKRVLLEKAG